MSNLNNINLNLELGQEILVGNNNERAKIQKLNTTTKPERSTSIPREAQGKY